MTYDEVLAALREVTGSRLDPQARAQIADVERAGSRVTIYEVTDLDPAPVIIIAHDGPHPSPRTIRDAYERAHRRAAGGES